MRKQLRSSDILYIEYNVCNMIKDVANITVLRRDDVVAKHLLVTTTLLNSTTYSERIRTNPEYLQKELSSYVKQVNRLLKMYRNECSNKA